MAEARRSEPDPVRRCVLQACAAAAVGAAIRPARADDEDDPRKMKRPQPGDCLVRAEGDQAGTVITADDMKPGEPQLVAWAMDPAAKIVRNGSRLNQVLLVRFDPSALGPKTQPHAVEGIVAYSAICTHAQCTVTGWIADKQILHCPCHQSEYDPAHDAKVVSGPAPRPLAALPLKIADGKPVVAGSFIGKIGMDQPMM